MLSALTLQIFFILIVLVLFLPRKYVLFPFIVSILFIPTDQAIIISGCNFYVIQLLSLVAVIRHFIRGEVLSIKWNAYDKLLFAWAVTGAVLYSLLWGMEGVVYKSGRLLELLGMYWVFRQNITTCRDMTFALKLIILISFVLLPFVMYEQATATNLFYHLGRVRTAIREGRLRCSASFSHPILFGSFGASMFPIAWGMLKQSQNKIYIVGMCIFLYYVIASASSGPILSLASAVGFLLFFKFRKYSRNLIWWLLGISLLLQIVMKSPVWYIIAKINIVGGSTGWHRANLIDKFVRHFQEWALLGVQNVEHWGVHAGDVTNQFILEGVRGGLAGMVLYIILIFMSLRILKRASISARLKNEQWLYWGFCVSLVSDCVSFMSVSYFGQMSVYLTFKFAIISMLYGLSRQEAPLLTDQKKTFRNGNKMPSLLI